MSPCRLSIPSAAGVFFLVALLYLPTLGGGFVYDSIAQVLYSDYLHTPAHWNEVLTLRVVAQDELDRNRPLHLVWLMADAAIWGRNPSGYRLTSVLLHALNAALVFAVLLTVLQRRTTGGGGAAATSVATSPPSATSVGLLSAAFGALLFALHPLVVEAVAEPSNREDVLVLLPLLIGLLGIVAMPSRRRWALSALLVLCSFLGVLAKESGIALPFVFAVALWLFRRDDFRGYGLAIFVALLVASGFLVASYLWRPGESAIFAAAPAPLTDDFWSSFAVQTRIWTLQLWQILWPWHLSAHYGPDAIAEIDWPVALAVMLAVGAGAFFLSHTDRLAALGVAVYVLCLLPASNFAAQFHPIADRYLYAPLAGVGLIVAALAGRWLAHDRQRPARILPAIVLLTLLSFEYAANLRRQFIWQQPETLWTDVLRQSPRQAPALLGMANVHYRAGDFAAARSAATEAVVISDRRWADAWAVRAVCEWQTGARERARESLRQARTISRVYRDEDSVAAGMVFSPEQLAVFGEIVREP